MKKRAVLDTEPKKAKHKGQRVTAQELGPLVVLNYWNDKRLEGRYAIDTQTLEFASYSVRKAAWSRKRFNSLMGYHPGWDCRSPSRDGVRMDTSEDEMLLRGKLEENERLWLHDHDIFDLLERAEQEYNSDRRWRQERGRIRKLEELMEKVPPVPAGIQEWAAGIAAKDKDFMFWDTGTKTYQCTNCGSVYTDAELADGSGRKKIRDCDIFPCPGCGKEVQAKKRTKGVKEPFHFYLIQNMDEKTSVDRCFDGEFIWTGGRHYLAFSESARLVLYRSGKYIRRLYYNQYTASQEREWKWDAIYEEEADGYRDRNASFDRGNRGCRKSRVGYLYPDGIREGLEGTYYEPYARIFAQMAALGAKAQYNKLLESGGYSGWQEYLHMAEYLAKGRFFRLLAEATDRIDFYYHRYEGCLHTGGKNLEEVFGIRDRQKINRIRDEDGGEQMVEWMRWSEHSGQKISREAVSWLIGERIRAKDIRFLDGIPMTLLQAINYLRRQQAEGYQGKRAWEILGQWEDYLGMCKKLKKNLSDEMVYRPRELKRRHDEAVAEIELKGAEITAEEYRNRFPGVEEVLAEVREKLSYQGEEYFIRVPETCAQIVAEGLFLHHCAGASDRYFDRIRQRETYICFLRKVSEPDTPYYTIEVEPGGTIRQHRGYLDEEPDIELIRPFLKEWQKVIRKRMDQEDQRLAGISAVKREENIEELKASNNTRVLNGLLEDFMEAV